MGLDMYAFRCLPTDLKNPDAQVDLEFVDPDFRATKITDWRKFNALHGWMERLYREKGGTQQTFNCASVRLHADDLGLLSRALDKTVPGETQAAGALKPVSGFFFGGQSVYEGDLDGTRKFIADALRSLSLGEVVFYDSWW